MTDHRYKLISTEESGDQDERDLTDLLLRKKMLILKLICPSRFLFSTQIPFSFSSSRICVVKRVNRCTAPTNSPWNRMPLLFLVLVQAIPGDER